MSGAGYLARAWAREPIVCFSILLGSVGTCTVAPAPRASRVERRAGTGPPSDDFRARSCAWARPPSSRPLFARAGIAIPLFVPEEWRQKRDSRLRQERLAASEATVREALSVAGMFASRPAVAPLSCSCAVP
jgi:hypothetical protein